jgi:hypothetical protein
MRQERHTSQEAKLAAPELPHGLMADGFSTPGKLESVSASFEEIHYRADTISPCLQELLDRRPPSHWGLNE